MSNDPDLIEPTTRRYRVFLIASASYGVVVEADSPEDAVDKAELEGAPTLCHQCSRIDLGDFEASEDDVEEVDA